VRLSSSYVASIAKVNYYDWEVAVTAHIFYHPKYLMTSAHILLF